jgi:ABC-type branched-subunit amino acid transport system ATPase component/ABC-type branched-subunit amino acid transport system permease subunit
VIAWFKGAYATIRPIPGASTALLTAIVVLLIVVAQFLLDDYGKSVADTILIASLSAMALTVLMGWAGQASLLTAGLLLLGGYCGWFFGELLHLPFVLVVPVTVVCGAVVGAIASLPARRLSGMYLLLTTLALQFILFDLGNVLQSHTRALAGFSLADPQIGPLTVASTGDWLWLSASGALVVFVYFKYLSSTRFARALSVIREDREAARVAGVDTVLYVGLAFALTSGVTAIGGLLLASFSRTVSYDAFTILLSVSFIVMVVFGGMGSVGGALIGAGAVTMLPILLTDISDAAPGVEWLQQDLSYIQQMVYGVVGMLLLLLAPRGVAGIWTAGRQWVRRVRRRTRRDATRDMEVSSTAAKYAANSFSESESGLAVVDDVHVEYSAGEVGLAGASVTIPERGVLAVLGRNGAGKTTLLSAIAGFPPGSGGRITTGDVIWNAGGRQQSLRGVPTAGRMAKGIVLVPAEDKVFRELTVEDHLREALASGRAKGNGGTSSDRDDLFRLFPALKHRLQSRAGSLSGGERQQLALACAIARRARLLLIDEASLGLAPIAVAAVTDVLIGLRERSVATMVVVEQNPAVAFRLADQLALMDGGRIVAAGRPTTRFQRQIERSYLGIPPTEHKQGRSAVANHHTGKALGIAHADVMVNGVQALSDVTLDVADHQLLGIIGANGAGKTSLLNLISGYYRANRGRIELAGRDVTGLSPHRISALGVGRSFQAVGHITELSVVELIMLGFEARWGVSIGATLAGLRSARSAEKRYRAEAVQLLDSANLEAYADVRLSECPYGIRKLADLLRVFAGRPSVLLLDEPTSGVSKSDRATIDALIRNYWSSSKSAILLVDHDVDFVSSLCEDLLVLSSGSVLAHGPREDVLANPEVIRSFVGREHGD